MAGGKRQQTINGNLPVKKESNVCGILEKTEL